MSFLVVCVGDCLQSFRGFTNQKNNNGANSVVCFDYYVFFAIPVIVVFSLRNQL
jgi:hypothetical protein